MIGSSSFASRRAMLFATTLLAGAASPAFAQTATSQTPPTQGTPSESSTSTTNEAPAALCLRFDEAAEVGLQAELELKAIRNAIAGFRSAWQSEPFDLAVLSRYLGPARDNVDLDLLVQRTELFTPADIEFAARQGAQAAFERDVLEHSGELAVTADYLQAIADARPTLSADAIATFEQDIDAYTRL